MLACQLSHSLTSLTLDKLDAKTLLPAVLCLTRLVRLRISDSPTLRRLQSETGDCLQCLTALELVRLPRLGPLPSSLMQLCHLRIGICRCPRIAWGAASGPRSFLEGAEQGRRDGD